MSEYNLYPEIGSVYPVFTWEEGITYDICPVCGHPLEYDKNFKRRWCKNCHWEEKLDGRR